MILNQQGPSSAQPMAAHGYPWGIAVQVITLQAGGGAFEASGNSRGAATLAKLAYAGRGPWSGVLFLVVCWPRPSRVGFWDDRASPWVCAADAARPRTLPTKLVRHTHIFNLREDMAEEGRGPSTYTLSDASPRLLALPGNVGWRPAAVAQPPCPSSRP
jgi:hypothetical protein